MAPRRPSAPVLIVEDNEETREVLRRVLEVRGYATATAGDGQAALDYLRGGKPACLISLDLRMPVMDGWALMPKLQADPRFAPIPVVAFSANIEGELPGAVATFRKASVDPELMLDVIDRACRHEVPGRSRDPG
jgi:CheY-like chemotaxis protein